MACKHGIRNSIEESKRYFAEVKKYDPFRAMWLSLVDRVYRSADGFDGLTIEEKTFYSVSVLDREVYNGGMYQFFSNSSGAIFLEVVAGLGRLRARESLALLLKAKKILFVNIDPPEDDIIRWELMPKWPEDDSVAPPQWSLELEAIDDAYCKGPDRLSEKLKAFAAENDLISPFILKEKN